MLTYERFSRFVDERSLGLFVKRAFQSANRYHLGIFEKNAVVYPQPGAITP
jgi:hypothetical protein